MLTDVLGTKMSYYNYHTLFPPGQAQDRVRGVRLPETGPTLDTIEEAFTSENWIIRIYKVKDLDNLVVTTLRLVPLTGARRRRARPPRSAGLAFSGRIRDSKGAVERSITVIDCELLFCSGWENRPRHRGLARRQSRKHGKCIPMYNFMSVSVPLPSDGWS